MFTPEIIETENTTKPLLQVAHAILKYRLETSNECSEKYRKNEERKIAKLENEMENNPDGDYTSSGIHYEALFYTALYNRHPFDDPYHGPSVFVSTGQEDQRGIDFIIKTKKSTFPIDVTTNPKQYPKKLRNRNTLSILLPMEDPRTKKEFLSYFRVGLYPNNLEDFLQRTFWLNTYIMNNKHSNYTVWVKDKGKKVKPSSKRYQQTISPFQLPTFENTYDINISKSKQQSILDLLSVVKNSNP